MTPSTDPPSAPGARPRATSERLSEADYQSNPVDYLIYCCHLATYDFAIPYVRDRAVLDFGCGTGYGTHRLAAVCSRITGVDISDEAVDYATRAHQAPNLDYQQIRPLPEHPAPFPDGSFEAITSFQVIEHIWDVDAYVDELRGCWPPAAWPSSPPRTAPPGSSPASDRGTSTTWSSTTTPGSAPRSSAASATWRCTR